MENPPDKFDENQNDFKEEWADFCSSCKSVLESICSVGEPSDLYKFLEDSNGEENRSAREFQGHEIAIEIANTRAINRREKNSQTITASLSGEQKTNNIQGESHNPMCKKLYVNRFKSSQYPSRSCQEFYFTKILRVMRLARRIYIHMNTVEKVILTVRNVALKRNHEKFGDLTKVVDDDILATAERNSKLLKSYNPNLKTEKTLQEIVRKHASTKVESFIDSTIFLSSAEPSIKSHRELNSEDTSNILKARSSILQTTNRLMDLSNFLDNMREVIVRQVKKQTTRNDQSIKKALPDCETNARTTNVGKRRFNEISIKENLMYTYNPFSGANKKKEKNSRTTSEI